MADLENFPDSVMMEILSRVPPESLIRFKCVSKSWYALINDPKFGCSLPKRNVLVKRIVNNNETGNREIIFSFLKYPLAADDDTPLDVEDVHFPSFGEEEFTYTSICGHSHGLLCFYVDPNHYIFLYNPATGDLRKLPPSILLIPYDSYSRFYGPHLCTVSNAVGFGYDPKSGDFKVVSVVDFVPIGADEYDTDDDEPSYDHYLPAKAEVYDLKKDEWREIETPIPGRVFGALSFEMHYQGFYYWWAKSVVESAEIILWFDMSEEVFGQIPVPECFERFEEDNRHRSLGVLHGSIVLFHYPIFGDTADVDERSLDVWGMDKLGGVVSWSKLFTIGPIFANPTPLAFVGSDELLMETCGGQLILYNINTQHLKHLPLEGNRLEFQATVFVKTLLSVNGNGGHKHN